MTVAQIAPAIQHLAIDLDSVIAHPQNPRKGRVAEIRASLERFGQLRPIIVQESTRYIVGGNHVARAARQLGWDQIAALVTDLDDTKALALLVALNRTSDLGEYDDEAVLAMIQSLSEPPPGFSDDDVDDLVRRVTGEVREVQSNGVEMKEIVLTLGSSHRARFFENVDRLRATYGTSDLSQTVLEAVKREHGS